MRRIISSLLLLALHLPVGARNILPVFIADNHGETFGWVSRTFDLDQRFQLVLVDAHTDASATERSEEIREQLRRVPNMEARAKTVEKWRTSGRIQAFNWIEPLMPRPFESVCWLAATELDPPRLAELHNKGLDELDGRLEVEPRASGSFANRWQTVDLAGFLAWDPGNQPLVLSIDLDFFVGMAAAERGETFEAIWQRAMEWPGLAGVAFSVSRPWLENEREADALVQLACDAVHRTRGATLEIDASIDDRPDGSNKAGEHLTSSKSVPRWDAATAPDQPRNRLLAFGDRLKITDRKRDWEQILGKWKNDSQPLRISPEGGQVDCDDVWRFAAGAPPVLRVEAPAGATGRVRWYALEPAQAAYDLLPHTGLGKSFSSSPARWIYYKRRSLVATEDFALAPSSWHSGGPGSFRIEAEVEMGGGWMAAPPVELRLAEGNGFRASLSECFHMPYVFGVAGMNEISLTGVETGWGSDCSNMLIYAWRRNGRPLQWGDPGRLRSQLATKQSMAIRRDEIERGIAIDFGKHVAALWEDREPLGELDGNDLVIHHLGNFPKIITLAEISKERPRFSLRVPRQARELRLKVAGDVVLAGEERVEIPGMEKGSAALFLANLEGVPSLKIPEHAPRYDFRFPPARLEWLRFKGVDVVSLANNHAGDAGEKGLVAGLKALHAIGLAAVGAGRNAVEACQPWRTEQNGVRVAIFGICLVDSMVAGDNQAGVAKLPEHSALLEGEILRAKLAGEQVIIMSHGGSEYRLEATDSQRAWAKWLVARGANLIVGAHPHVIQRSETYGGAIIVHSLGNAVYPKHLKGLDSGHVREFILRNDGSVSESNLSATPLEKSDEK